MTTLHVQTPTGLKPVKAYMYRSSTSKVGLCCTVNQAKDAAFSAMVAAQGTGWLRFDAFWAGIETAQGVYNWADLDAAINQTVASGMKPLVIIQTTPQWVSGNSEWTMGPVTASARTAYANFCRTLALRYMEKLGAIEIWNEANLAMFWKPTPSVADYIALARPAVAAIRSVLPTVPIISHGIGGAGAAPDIGHVAWLDAFYSQGGHLKTPGTPAAGLLFDGIGLHAYEAETSGIGWGMERVRERMVSYSSPQPIWLTECGAPTAPPGSLADGWTVTEAKQAELVAATLTDFVQRSPQGVCTLYSAKDRNSVSPGSREDVFGLWKSDNTPKAAVAVYATAARKSRLVPLTQAPTIVSPPPLTFDAAFPAAGVMGSYSDPNPNNLVTGGTTVDSTDPALDVWLVTDPVTPSRVVACCDSRNGKTTGNANPRASMTTGEMLPLGEEYWQVFSWRYTGKIASDDWNALWTGGFGPPYNGPSPLSLALQPTATAGKNLLRFSRTFANGGVNWSGVEIPVGPGWVQIIAHFKLADAGWLEMWLNTGPGPNNFVKVVPLQNVDMLAPGSNGPQYSSIGVYGPLPKRILFGVHQIATGPNGKLALTPDDFGPGFNPALLP